jgi:DNA/RNA endonuclease G (NUC1)
MRIRILSLALLAIALPLSSCSDKGILAPIAPPSSVLSNHMESAPPQVRISEIHYDNGGTDSGEAIEISGPAGTDVTGWKIYLYNGSNGLPYEPTRTLAGTIPESCEGRGVLFQTYPVNGIQNGDPDGIALVDDDGHVIEFLSYEGTFDALDGPAKGMKSTLIPVREVGSELAGLSIKRRGTGGNVWEAPTASNFGTCNDNDQPPAEVVRVEVTPASATVAQGSAQQFSAIAYDAADQPIVGASITWSSSNANASVSSTGIARGDQPGDAQIIATSSNGKSDAAELLVGPPPEVRLSEIHYDNFDTDVAEAVEVEGPAGTDLTGWKIVLYNGSGGARYAEFLLDGVIPATAACNGRGVLYTLTPDIQNGAPDGLALVDAAGVVVEFLSYEGSFTAIDGVAAGRVSGDIGIFENPIAANVGQSMQRNAAGTIWTNGPHSFGVCNGTGVTPPPFGNSITFSGRVATDPALPVGFEDQIFATLRNGEGVADEDATFTWVSETPDIASIDADGVMRALSAGVARLRATANDGTTRTYSLPTHVATESATALYEGNAEFGEPDDGNRTDEIIIVRDQLISSFNTSKGTPNWVAYEIDGSHFGPQDRCDCFTYDPELPAAGKYTTADYTGAGEFHGYLIDRGHLARSFDRTAGSLDNAYTYYFSNIIPQAADNNQGPWAAFESYLGNRVLNDGREVYVLTGPAGDKGTVKNEGKIVIPTDTWKVAVIMPKDKGIEDVDSYDDVEVIAVIMPNEAGIRNVDWTTYKRTVDQVEALSGYDLLKLLPDQIEIAVESNTKPPVAAVDGPYVGIEGERIAMSGSQSTDADGDALTYAWGFGDGTTGTGENVTHIYRRGGTFTVRLTVTDTRGLSDAVETTAKIATWSEATGNAITMVELLEAGGKINTGDARWIQTKLYIAQKHYQMGLNIAGDNQIEEILRRLDAMVQSGDALAGDVAALRLLVTRIMNASS